jgi:hypothetical protein
VVTESIDISEENYKENYEGDDYQEVVAKAPAIFRR